jgi:hypothetical protein
MDWGKSSPGFDSLGYNPMGPDSQATTRYETVELVGPHLRVSGEVSLANFGRLSDMINHNRGYIRLKDAHLLRRNGEPTDLVVPELMVNQDEVTFVGQSAEAASPAPGASDLPGGSMDRPLMSRVQRQVVIFTEGHTLTGAIHAFAETDIAQFVDSPDPRFVALVDVTARSLSDRRVVSKFGLALVNRTRMTAASFLENAGAAAETGVAVE